MLLQTQPKTHELVRYQKWYRWVQAEKSRLPLRAAYFNERLEYWRSFFAAKPDIQTYPCRRLRPYTDTYGFTYYRNIRDKFVPDEAYTYGMKPKYLR